MEVDAHEVAHVDGTLSMLNMSSGTHHAEGCYVASLGDISMPVVEAQCPTLYDYVYFVC